MGRLRDLSKKLKSVTVESQERDLLKIVADNAPYAVDLNIEQMMEGLDSEGKPISPPYTPFTVEIKEEKGQPSDRVTLRDEGDFHRGMLLAADKWPALFDSSDPKTDDLTDKYGEGIFGLNKSKRGKLAEQIKDQVRNYYGEITSV